jgi:hypothetical protein
MMVSIISTADSQAVSMAEALRLALAVPESMAEAPGAV